MQTTAILATVLFEGHVADLIGSRCIRRHAVLGDEHGRVGRRRPTRPVLTHTFLSLLPRTLQREWSSRLSQAELCLEQTRRL